MMSGGRERKTYLFMDDGDKNSFVVIFESDGSDTIGIIQPKKEGEEFVFKPVVLDCTDSGAQCPFSDGNLGGNTSDLGTHCLLQMYNRLDSEPESCCYFNMSIRRNLCAAIQYTRVDSDHLPRDVAKYYATNRESIQTFNSAGKVVTAAQLEGMKVEYLVTKSPTMAPSSFTDPSVHTTSPSGSKTLEPSPPGGGFGEDVLTNTLGGVLGTLCLLALVVSVGWYRKKQYPGHQQIEKVARLHQHGTAVHNSTSPHSAQVARLHQHGTAVHNSTSPHSAQVARLQHGTAVHNSTSPHSAQVAQT